MGDYTARFSELHYPLLVEYVDGRVIGVNSSAWVDVAIYHRCALVVNVGDMAVGARLDVYLQQATTVGGLGGKAITGKVFTPLTQPAGDGDDLLCMELQTEELDVDNDFHFIRVVYHVVAAVVELSWVLYGIEPRFGATPTTNWTEIVG